MADMIELEVATPERELVREPVSEVQVPGAKGYLGILPGHAPLLSLLGAGALSFLVAGKRKVLAVQGGFLEVLPEHVRVLANVAERGEEIDLAKARAELAAAQEQLNNLGDRDPESALDRVALAQARVDAAEQKP